MSRLADYSKLSETECSDMDSPDGHPLEPATPFKGEPKTPSRRRELVPKSTCKPSTKRVRRLHSEKLATENPLFQPWTTESSQKILKFANDVSPRKPAPPFSRPTRHPSRLFSGSRLDDSANQGHSLLNATMLSRASSSDFDESSEPDIGDVTLPPSLQMAAHSRSTELANRIPRLKVNGPHETCNTILEGAEDSTVLDAEAASVVGRGSSPTEDSEVSETELLSQQLCNEIREADDGIGLPEMPSPTPLPVLRPPEPLSPRDNNQVMRSPKKTSNQKSLSLLRNPLAYTPEEKENGSDIENSAVESTVVKGADSSPTMSTKLPKGLKATGGRRLWSSKFSQNPSAQQLWSQEGVSDWDDGDVPRKLVRPISRSAKDAPSPSKSRFSPFENTKKALAEDFLGQLDAAITEGRIAELAESTGGVKLVWTKTLNTTAGRANWKKETVRTTAADGTEVNVRHNHHASIELAEKVIDDEHRLLNVLAHEFCHLANFMISGVTNNPHGKEFKVWASRCSAAFGARGVKVTTKHTYDIDFKYVWKCVDCASDYKRHSKSINTDKHRCGGCKGKLAQTKPKPRNAGKPSEYQLFVKEQMQIIRKEHPGSPQKAIMRMAAERWASRPKAVAAEDTNDTNAVEQVVDKLLDMTLGEKCN